MCNSINCRISKFASLVGDDLRNLGLDQSVAFRIENALMDNRSVRVVIKTAKQTTKYFFKAEYYAHGFVTTKPSGSPKKGSTRSGPSISPFAIWR